MNDEEATDEALIRESVEQLFRHLLRNQESMRALITAHGDPDSEHAAREATRRLDDFFQRLNELGRQRAARSNAGFDPARLHLTHRFMVGLVFDVTALHPWFVPSGWNRPTEHELIEEITAFVSYGFLGSPSH
ncbi:hypothetical protein ACFXG4_38250 [Nocardia sp. NPDC059246]|uniref:hypothetical protein n=1 Tax=unclassified Nocardia TaxID=2637762 RepID=UPI0036C7ADE0